MNSTKKHILIVDDDEAILESIKLILEDEGFIIDTAPNGEIMQDKLAQSQYSMIILDYKLPGTNGTELTRILKNDIKTQHIPVVIVSSHNVADLAKAAGASAFFEKPFDIETLLDVVEKHIS